PPVFRLPGPTGYHALALAVADFHKAGRATDHDTVVAKALARVLTGGETDITREVTEAALLDLERETFMTLLRDPATLARIEHMLETGKPLRN
ncbi:MAG: 3-hydroxyacyl-CoA dehydrogenase, partial [Alphaproteobacteria bacterium]|nr:3-hydroxyacyl-CoA dehydrogenase [Alphaproteobacteria bacterium]